MCPIADPDGGWVDLAVQPALARQILDSAEHLRVGQQPEGSAGGFAAGGVRSRGGAVLFSIFC